MADEKKSEKLAGSVKWFNSSKGFGFITPDDGGEELFVHQSAIHADGFRSLREGEPVEYEVEEGDDGRTRASHVTGPSGAFVQGAPRRDGFRGGERNGGASSGFASVAGRGRGRGGRGGSYGGNGYSNGGDEGAAFSCYNCGRSGHIARECTQKVLGNSRSTGAVGNRNCYNCGGPGHMARECTATVAA